MSALVELPQTAPELSLVMVRNLRAERVMGRDNDSLLYNLSLCPWWVSVVLAGMVYVGVGHVAPAFIGDVPVVGRLLEGALRSSGQVLGGAAGAIFLLPAAVSFANRLRKKRLLDRQRGIESIRRLSWREFEELVAEAFRRDGYSVTENVAAGADGGVDVRLRKDGRPYLVQCKHWARSRVGVPVVREMFGVMTAESAAGVFVVCTGGFTAEAREFARAKPITLVDGTALVEMVDRVRQDGWRPEAPAGRGAAVGPDEGSPATSREEKCPRCGSDLVVRTAGKGKRKGGRFLGCETFPKCRFTQDLATS